MPACKFSKFGAGLQYIRQLPILPHRLDLLFHPGVPEGLTHFTSQVCELKVTQSHAVSYLETRLLTLCNTVTDGQSHSQTLSGVGYMYFPPQEVVSE